MGPAPCRSQLAMAWRQGPPLLPLQNVSDARCTPEANLLLPSVYGDRTYDVAVTYTPVGTTSLAFTPRGGVVAGNVQATVKIAVSNQLPLRCVRISFGSISTGINNATGDVAQTCNVWERT